MKHLINENILMNGLVPFDMKAAEEAADREQFEYIEWVITGKITTPKSTLRDKTSFVAGARYQHFKAQEEILKLKAEIAELREFKQDAIKMAADFYMNRPNAKSK